VSEELSLLKLVVKNDNIDYRQGVGSDAGSLLYFELTVIKKT